MTDQKTRMGHPRSFGGMRLTEGPNVPIGFVCYEMPDGKILMWDKDWPDSPIVERKNGHWKVHIIDE